MSALVFDRVTRSPVEVDALVIDGVRLIISRDDDAENGFVITEICGSNNTTIAIPKDAVLAMAEQLKG